MNRKRINYLLAALVLSSTSATGQGIRPDGALPDQIRWRELGNRTDDFEGNRLDTSKWINNPSDLVIGAWTFDENNAFVRDGKLHIQATQETHTRTFQDACWDGVAGGSPRAVQRELYYKSGAVKSSNDGVYGYYEASIKGVDMYPGLSPAFWLYSDGHPFPDAGTPGSVDYSEIDIVELQQADWYGPGPNDADPVNVSDHNLHARVFDENGNRIWLRPKPNPETQLLKFEADHDPSKDFHTYAVENRPDRIFWYVDGELIGSKPNTYWHRPMHVIFSMGLRRQFIYYNAACQRADPNPNTVTAAGFPERTTMQVEYVKTWEVLPSVWLDDANKYTRSSFTGELDVVVHYHGGSNSHVANGPYRGITVNLVEKNQNGFVRIAASGYDDSVLNRNKRHGGQTSISLDLSNVTPSNQLPNGHYYALAPVFTSSAGQDVFLVNPVEHVIIGGNGSPTPTPTPTNTPSPAPSPTPTTPPAEANGIGNGGFEGNQLAPWNSVSGNPRIVQSNAKSGTHALRFDGVMRLEQTLSVQPNTTYTLRGSGRVDSSGQNSVMGVRGIAAGQASVQFKSAQYQEKSVSFTTTASDTTATVYLYNGQASHSGWFDDISLSGGDASYSDTPVSSIQVTPENLSLRTGESIRLTATVLPSDATNKAVFWTSSDSNAVSVENGVVTAHRDIGHPVTITATTEDGLVSDSTTITVRASATSCDGSWVPVSGVSISPTTITLKVGEQIELSPNVTPTCASNKKVTYLSSNARVATANQQNILTARAPGEATITVKTKHRGFEANVNVRVVR